MIFPMIAVRRPHQWPGRPFRVAASAALLVWTSVASGQASPEELRREIDRLQGQVRSLQQELQAARAEQSRVLEDNTRLRNSLAAANATIQRLRGASPGVTSAPDAPQGSTPADALASPRSLHNELARRYAMELGVLPRESEAHDRTFHEQARRWCRVTHTELRGKRSWLTTIEGLKQTGRSSYEGMITVLEEGTLLPLSDPMVLPIPARFAKRIEREGRHPLWRVTAIVIADPRYNAERTEVGVFDVPPFVGPHIDFGFDLQWIGIAGEAIPTPETRPDVPMPTEPRER